MAGGRRADSSRTAGKATTKACCSTSSASVRRRIRCRPRVMRAYCATYQWKTIYGRELLYSGPLFTHQLSHLWIDFRGIRDAFMRDRGSDYFENSRQATFVQQEYAIRNPRNFVGYGKHCWGFTACDGPGWVEASRSMASNASSSTTSPAAPHSARTTAPSPRGSSWPRFRLPRRSSFRRSATLPAWIWA